MAARSIPLTATKSSGQLITGALWNAGPYYLGSFLLNVPIFRAQQANFQNVTTSVWTSMALDSTDVDTDGGHSNVTNNSRYTCQVPGWYWVEGYFSVGIFAQSRFAAAIYKNGSPIAGSMQTTVKINDLQSIAASAIVQLAAGDYVETLGWHNVGSTITTFAGADLRPCMNAFWIHA